MKQQESYSAIKKEIRNHVRTFQDKVDDINDSNMDLKEKQSAITNMQQQATEQVQYMYKKYPAFAQAQYLDMINQSNVKFLM